MLPVVSSTNATSTRGRTAATAAAWFRAGVTRGDAPTSATAIKTKSAICMTSLLAPVHPGRRFYSRGASGGRKRLRLV